ncbi:MAG: leucyl aminopeptidase family protein [Cytophagales bacterium]|nr:leucyl aminopeptidase family protein [Bernardetiaceae bacterium]MDW8210862.1 leucyl aminopeptidase family protein [Cytophagales bacterium]
MQVHLSQVSSIESSADLAILIANSAQEAFSFCNSKEEEDYLLQKIQQGEGLIVLNQWKRKVYCLALQNIAKENSPTYEVTEKIRRSGGRIAQLLKEDRSHRIQVTTEVENAAFLFALVEGIALGAYQFLKYQPEKLTASQPLQIDCCAKAASQGLLKELANVINANFLVRDLVNEPPAAMNISQLCQQAQQAGVSAGFETRLMRKAEIEALQMNGLLTVNKGSFEEPAFIEMTYCPRNAVNANPLVLVGKGIVYDTGGYSIKTEGMEWMKCDMAGAAIVIGTLHAIAANQLPCYVIGLVPVTDNRISAHAYVPGDIITYANGKTVEVINTDAEGRLILADALIYAQKFAPHLVVDVATLTGSAIRAIGWQACAMMCTAGEEIKQKFAESARATYERFVEFPLWEEYDEYLKSNIAHLKNVGPPEAGAITAAKFLQHFTNYPWIHLDVAGVVLLKSAETHRPAGATGFGVRLLYDFAKRLFGIQS